MPEYRPLREGELILEGDRFNRSGETGSIPNHPAISGVGDTQGYNPCQYFRRLTQPDTQPDTQPVYRPLAEGEIVQEGDMFSMVNGVPVEIAVSGVGYEQGCEEADGLQYYRVASLSQTKTPPHTGAALFDALNDLVAIGYKKLFPKWSQWEEIVLAQELVDGISNNGWRELKDAEIIQSGDQHNGAQGSEWTDSIAIGRTVGSQRCGSLYKYRRPVKLKSKRITPAIKAKLIEAIEAILYMGKDEGYNDWEFLNAVVFAKKLVAEQKKGK